MESLKKFAKTKQAKRFVWTIVNALMGLVVAYITYLAGTDVTWAITIMPIATALAQLLTKELNSKATNKESE